jgi:hypothetical protein
MATKPRRLTAFLTVLIDIAWYAAIVLLVLSVAMLAIAPFVNPPDVEIGLSVPAAFRLVPSAHTVPGVSGAENVRIINARGDLRFSPRNRVVVANAAVFLIIVFAAGIWVLGQLRGVFRTLRAGQPFVPANAVRIRRIAYAVILSELAHVVISYAVTRYVMTNFSLDGVLFETRLEMDGMAIVYGLIILVIAEVFREGTRLDQDQSLTI